MIEKGLVHEPRVTKTLPNFRVKFLKSISEREARGFQTWGGGLPLFSEKSPDCVASPVGSVPYGCFLGREEEKDKSGNSPKKSGKSEQNWESPKNEQKRMDHLGSGKPRLPALEICPKPWLYRKL